MDRRDTLRSLLLGGLAGSGLLSACVPETDTVATTGADKAENLSEGYGRTAKEIEHDAEIQSETFLRPHEMATLAILTDIIVPADERSDSATQAGVPDFIEFIAKEIPEYQTPLRGGLAWLNGESVRRFKVPFVQAAEADRLSIIDAIAYPDKVEEGEAGHGVKFFDLMRFLTLTGFYTSEMGVKTDLQYAGNYPTVWDGVPEEELTRLGLAYEPEWLAKCVDQSKRSEVAQWDAEGRLLT